MPLPSVRSAGLALLLVVATPAWAACDGPVETVALLQSVEQAEIAFGAADLDAFRSAVDQLDVGMPCTGSPLPRNVAASIHRVQALRAFADRDPERAKLAFASARSIEPGYRLPETVVPSGHPVRALYDAAPIASLPSDTVPLPAGGYLVFDGRQAPERPATVPTLAQWVGGDGLVRQTAYLWPGEALFAYEPAAAVSAPVVGEAPRGRGPGLRIALLSGAGVATLASAALYGVAGADQARYNDREDPLPYEEGEAVYARNHALVGAGTGTLVLAVGFGAAGLVLGPK